MELVKRLKQKMDLIGSTVTPDFDRGLLRELESVNRMLDAGEPIGAVLDAFEPTFAKILGAVKPRAPLVFDDADNSDRLMRRVQRLSLIHISEPTRH